MKLKKLDKRIPFMIILFVIVIGFSIFLALSLRPKIQGEVVESGESFIGNRFVTKVIDGDTVIIGGESVRLLGIDADESGYPCYYEAKKRIEDLILNKEVFLEEDQEDKDQYGRYLRYIFLNGKNINLQLVKEGFAVARFSSQNIKYKEEILDSERHARESKIGCKWEQKEIEEEVIEQVEEQEGSSIEIVGACNAGNYIGKEKIVEGKIIDTYKYKATSIFLNFEKPYPNPCFTAVIWSSDWYKFPENAEDYYYGKTVRIRGEIIEYKGRPEIILKDMSQIWIIK